MALLLTLLKMNLLLIILPMTLLLNLNRYYSDKFQVIPCTRIAIFTLSQNMKMSFYPKIGNRDFQNVIFTISSFPKLFKMPFCSISKKCHFLGDFRKMSFYYTENVILSKIRELYISPVAFSEAKFQEMAHIDLILASNVKYHFRFGISA